MTIGELWRRLSFLLRFDKRTQELEEEMRLHIDLRAARLAENGTPDEEAYGAARRRFGNTAALGEAAREIWGGETVDGLLRDVRVAARALRRSTTYSIASVTALAIGVGASAIIFALVNTILLRPLPYERSDRVVDVQHALPGLKMEAVSRATLGMVFTYARLSKTIEGIAAYKMISVTVGDDRRDGTLARTRASQISVNTFSVLDAGLLMGRPFSATEDTPGGPAAVLISERLWRELLQADRGVLGKTLTIDGSTYPVVGVMREDFRFPEATTDIWLPLKADPLGPYSGGFEQQSIARLRPGVDIRSAERELQGLLAEVPKLYPFFAPGMPTAAMHTQVKPEVHLRSLRESVTVGLARVLWLVAGSVALVMIAAGANVMNLMVVRMDSRRRELAVRSALGGGRLRLARHLVTEVGLISSAGAMLGLIGAAVGIRLFVHFAPPTVPRVAELQIDADLVWFTAVLATAFAVCSAAVAVWRSEIGDIGTLLRTGDRAGAAVRGRHRLRAVLVAGQAALAMVLLGATGVLARSVAHVREVEPGFRATNVLSMWVALPEAKYRDGDAIVRFMDELRGRLTTIPGVVSVAATTKLPLDNEGLAVSPIWPETGPLATASLPPLGLVFQVTGSYFDALRIPLIAGRSVVDNHGADPEAVINASLANAIWGDSTGTSVVGQRLRLQPGGVQANRVYRIVGVASDVRDTSLVAAAAPAVYFGIGSGPDTSANMLSRNLGIVIRTATDPLAIVPQLRHEVGSIDRTVPVFNVSLLESTMSRSVARLSSSLVAFATGALVTLALCVIGLYGVVSYVVSLRTREIGLRIALGARPLNIQALVTRQGLRLGLAGALLGAGLFLVLARFLQTLVFGVTVTDSTTLIAACATLGVVSFVASWIPARRAAMIDPIDALQRD